MINNSSKPNKTLLNERIVASHVIFTQSSCWFGKICTGLLNKPAHSTGPSPVVCFGAGLFLFTWTSLMPYVLLVHKSGTTDQQSIVDFSVFSKGHFALLLSSLASSLTDISTKCCKEKRENTKYSFTLGSQVGPGCRVTRCPALCGTTQHFQHKSPVPQIESMSHISMAVEHFANDPALLCGDIVGKSVIGLPLNQL